mmetsp:Transcript_12165/g.26854  ORF Transcript_12165/g.26854 Transcript_12165/m.26854 type:complete len:115 (+) Transcript_12165:330-674(+)
MLDWEGQLVEPKRKPQKIILETIEEEAALVSSLHISDQEENYLTSLLADSENEETPTTTGTSSFDQAFSLRVEDGEFMMSIGSTRARYSEFLVDPEDDIPSVPGARRHACDGRR